MPGTVRAVRIRKGHWVVDRQDLNRKAGSIRPYVTKQWNELKATILIILAATALVLGTLVVIRMTTGIAIADFTRDPLGFTEYPWYKGAVSNLGIIIWSGAAAVCFFAYALGRRSVRWPQHARFLLTGGLITTLLVLDDLYMLHEVVFPDEIGIPERAVYATYMLILLVFVTRFRAIILRNDPLLLIGAFAGLGLSVLMDIVASHVAIPGSYIFEDGGKFFGILCWTAFLVRASARFLASTGHASASGSGATVRAGTSDRSRIP